MTVSSLEHGTPTIPHHPLPGVDHITVYRNGRFVTDDKPIWWDAEFERIYPESTERALSVRRVIYGNIGQASVTCWSFTRGRGRLVEVEDGSGAEVIDLWVPTDSDWLEFLTARLPALLDVSRQIDRATTA